MASGSEVPTGSLKDPLHSISFYIGRAHYAYVALLKRLLAEEGVDAHVRPGMGHILFALFEDDDLIIRDLAHRVQLAASTMTGMLTRMERGGLVVRTRDADDGRAMRVQLTPLGRSLEEPCRRVLAKLNDILEAPMTSQEVARLKNGFATVVLQLRRMERRLAHAPRGLGRSPSPRSPDCSCSPRSRGAKRPSGP